MFVYNVERPEGITNRLISSEDKDTTTPDWRIFLVAQLFI